MIRVEHRPRARHGRRALARHSGRRRPSGRTSSLLRLLGAKERHADRRLEGRGERVVFTGLSFRLPPGGALVLTGANGSGKSSLLRLVAGLSDASSRPLVVGSDKASPTISHPSCPTALCRPSRCAKAGDDAAREFGVLGGTPRRAPIRRGARHRRGARRFRHRSDRRLAVPLALGRSAAPRRARAPAGGARRHYGCSTSRRPPSTPTVKPGSNRRSPRIAPPTAWS